MKPYITCRELIDFIADYLEGSLPADALHEFERHLAVCPSCVNYLDSYKTTIEMGKKAMTAAPGEPPADVPEDLVRAILAARERDPR
jgi:anti-sigma factor RsiW